LNEIEQAYSDLAEFMRLLILQKREILSSGTNLTAYGNDLFSYLVRANDNEEKLSLTDIELVCYYSLVFELH
jgi:hypothetical protein